MRYLYLFLMGLFLINPTVAAEKTKFETLLPVLTAPVKGKEITPQTTKELETLFKSDKTLPRVFVKQLPPDFKEKGNKRLYSKVIGALILRENERILGEQVLFQLLKEKFDKGESWTKTEQDYFNSLVKKYDAVLLKTTSTKINDLLYKIDEIPLSMGIAQSALTTNWGMEKMNSPFAQKGWIDREQYTDISYDNLIKATESYAQEMNSVSNYDEFRRIRMQYNTEKRSKAPFYMVQGLRTYLPEVVDYVDQVKSLMNKNQFLYTLDEVIFE